MPDVYESPINKMVMGVRDSGLAAALVSGEDVGTDNDVEAVEDDARFGVTSTACATAANPTSRESASATLVRALVLRTVSNPQPLAPLGLARRYDSDVKN